MYMYVCISQYTDVRACGRAGVRASGRAGVRAPSDLCVCMCVGEGVGATSSPKKILDA